MNKLNHDVARSSSQGGGGDKIPGRAKQFYPAIV